MARDIYEDFLRLVGFEGNEIPEYLPVWREAAEILGLTAGDVRFASEEWIPAYYDLKLRGVRKLLGAYLGEAVDLTRANEYQKRGVKVVYGIMPAITPYYHALKLAAPDKVHVSFPDYFLTFVMNGMFHKLNPYLEEAEATGMTYGCRHCALNKTRYAARRLGVIPSPDVSWTWGFVCDEGPKTDEFIQLNYDPNYNYVITRLPHDQPWGTAEDEVPERVEYLANQMKDGFETASKMIGIKVREDKLLEALGVWNRYANKIAQLNMLMVADPQPLSGNEAQLFSLPLYTPFNTGFEAMERALDIALEEVGQRVANKEGVLPKGAPRLMIYLSPHSLPWIVKMFEQNGVGVPFSTVVMLTKKQLEPPSYEDLHMANAESWMRSQGGPNLGYEVDQTLEKIETYKPDGMLFGFFDFDRWLGAHQRMLAKIIEERAKIPSFYIEGDYWEDRDYSPEALRTRIESICEIMKMRKA